MISIFDNQQIWEDTRTKMSTNLAPEKRTKNVILDQQKWFWEILFPLKQLLAEEMNLRIVDPMKQDTFFKVSKKKIFLFGCHRLAKH